MSTYKTFVHKFNSLIFALTTILALVFLSACGATGVIPEGNSPGTGEADISAVILPLTLAQTAQGLEAVMSGANAPIVMESERLVMISWATGEVGTNFRAFTVFGKSGLPVSDVVNQLTGGQVVSIKNFSNLKDYLVTTGWREIPVSAIPATLATAIKGYIENAKNAVAGVASKMTMTILVIPVVPGEPFNVIATPTPAPG